MSATETQGDGRPTNRPGVYRDPQNGAEVIVRHHPKFGSAQADAAVRLGFVYVGTEEEVAAEAQKAAQKSSPEEAEAPAVEETPEEESPAKVAKVKKEK